MVIQFRSFLSFLLYSNLFISGVAAAMVWKTICLWNIHSVKGISLFVFLSSMTVYLLHSIRPDEGSDSPRAQWNRRNKNLLRVLFVTSFLFLLRQYFLMPVNPYHLLPAIVLTGYYFLPCIHVSGLQGVRPYFKTAILALTWTYVTLILPLLMAGTGIFTLKGFANILLEFSFLYMICLFFDHRDALTEKQHYFLFDIRRDIRLMILLNGSLFFFAVLAANHAGIPFLYLSVKTSIMFFLFATARISLNTRSDIWFYFLLDGMMAADLMYCLIA